MNDKEISRIDPADIARAAREAQGIKQDRFVIFASATGRDNWYPVPPDQVPTWLKGNLEIMGRLAAGEMAQDCAVGDRGSAWFKAVKVETLQ